MDLNKEWTFLRDEDDSNEDVVELSWEDYLKDREKVFGKSDGRDGGLDDLVNGLSDDYVYEETSIFTDFLPSPRAIPRADDYGLLSPKWFGMEVLKLEINGKVYEVLGREASK
jgi:hypothetical protein